MHEEEQKRVIRRLVEALSWAIYLDGPDSGAAELITAEITKVAER